MFLLITLAILSILNTTHSHIVAQEANSSTNYALPDTQHIKNTLSFISNDLTKGRLTGTPGNLIVSSFLRNKLSSLGMIPYLSNNFTQSFEIVNGENGEKRIGRNIIGVLPSLYYSDKYIILSAHYDHLGILGGSIYNGADDNASGVTALITMAEWFSQMRAKREGPRVNILFIFYDAKESSLAGSEHFAKTIKTPLDKIILNINLDQIGCTFAPPDSNENYLLYVASKKVREELRRKLNITNRFLDLNMEVDHSFYGSPTFYELFFKTSDQIHLAQKGVPSVMFTSGIHMHTYKPTDEYYFINYPVFINRIKLIYHTIESYVK